MMELEEVEVLLEEIIDGFPKELFDKLNGGILLLPEEKRNPDPRLHDLYILGEYHSGGGLGRYIVLYHGSFQKVFGEFGKRKLRRELEKTLKHEFVHHLESLAGERSLEKEDRQFIINFLEGKK
ncbi:metallopeptidase family protein [Alkalibacter rhizosphaerae]|uniref:Metallopeptidase family protein n=1 Tax=Alkalibacter rhizosphaerae TaxID=2815577 RepID=A0A975AI30_9FIRM|nr:metallopeptidase family protein [Alkalibacter rhizosphaerae]QSX08110.1 metallopeptidase family protein [Alkalibacter rhizosphaerae]